jgi:EAL domain-containing protein (putative c-di-GMP-specific phosphodiesterase class I)
MDANQPSPRKSLKMSAPGRVLLVDDDPLVRRSFLRILADSGVSVESAEHPLEALELLKEQSYDVVLSDIMMPGMTGLELLREVRAHDKDLPVVLLTGTPSVTTAVAALQEGALRYLTKPVNPIELCDVIRMAVANYRQALTARQAAERAGTNVPLRPAHELDAALDNVLDTMWMAFQPIVSAKTRARYGYEALLRAKDPSLPHPGAILDAAERLGRLEDIGRAIRAKVAQAMPSASPDDVFFVNLHPQDLEDMSLYAKESPLSAYANRIVLEITERAALEHVTAVQDRVNQLRQMGFRIAIDDLGAGYSSLTSLAQLAPDVVKLDMSLIRGITENVVKRRLVSSLSSVCHEMNGIVVAEGVETVEERDALLTLGVDLLQGYRLGRPAPAFPEALW